MLSFIISFFQLVVCISSVCPQTYKVLRIVLVSMKIDRTLEDQLTCLVKDVLICSSIPLCNCHSQCYDGAANMSEDILL